MKSTKSGQSNFSEQPPRRRICTSWIVPLLLLWVLPAGLGLMLAGRATAQTFTTLYSFGLPSPTAGLLLSGNTLYGSAGNTRGVRRQHRWHRLYEHLLLDLWSGY